MNPAAGYILVGGQSRRMGRDKALLPWRGRPLVQHVAERLSLVAPAVTLIGNPETYGHLGYTCLPDRRPGLGPLSGIETVLASQDAERNLVLACDMPGIDPDHLRHLLEQPAACVVTQDETGKLHPLCAVYHVSCLPQVRSALDEGRLKLFDLAAKLNPVIVRYPGVLANINTVEDLAAAQR